MPPSNLSFETSANGTNFVPLEVSDTNKKKLVGGDAISGITIAGEQYLRITITPRSYVYLNALYLYQSTNGSKHDYRIEKKKQATQKWETVKEFNEHKTVSD